MASENLLCDIEVEAICPDWVLFRGRTGSKASGTDVSARRPDPVFVLVTFGFEGRGFGSKLDVKPFIAHILLPQALPWLTEPVEPPMLPLLRAPKLRAFLVDGPDLIISDVLASCLFTMVEDIFESW